MELSRNNPLSNRNFYKDYNIYFIFFYLYPLDLFLKKFMFAPLFYYKEYIQKFINIHHHYLNIDYY